MFRRHGFLAGAGVVALATLMIGAVGHSPQAKPAGIGVLPAGCTDNTIARADGTAGNAQCSSVVIEDDGDVVLASGVSLYLTDTNVGIAPTGTNDLALRADGVSALILASASATLFNGAPFYLGDSSVGILESGTSDLDVRADNEVVGTWSGSGLSLSAGNAFTSTGAVGSGGTVNGMQVLYNVADFVATDTTPVNVTGISFALDINDVYSIQCKGRALTALASAGIQIGLNIPAGASVAAACTLEGVNRASFTTDDGVCGFGDGIATPGSEYSLSATVTMSSTAGNTDLRLRSETTDDVTISAGYRCEAKKLVDN